MLALVQSLHKIRATEIAHRTDSKICQSTINGSTAARKGSSLSAIVQQLTFSRRQNGVTEPAGRQCMDGILKPEDRECRCWKFEFLKLTHYFFFRVELRENTTRRTTSMPVGSLPAFNLLGVEEAKRREAEETTSFSSQMSGLWEQASGLRKRDDDDREKGGRHLWHSSKNKPNDSLRTLFGGTSKKKSSIDWGPGGAIGIGCGVGIGVGLTGGAGIGATPWSSLRVVFGVGAGCGLGVGYGYGYGYGMGLRWDKPPEQLPKRVVIEL